MTDLSKAKIFLSDERGLTETAWFRSRQTFNFGEYFSEHKIPFGNIYVANDDALDAGRSLRRMVEEYSYIILIPVMGAIAFKTDAGNENIIASGQVEILMMDKGETIEITNPFDEGLVNFLQIWVRADAVKMTKGSQLSTYNVNKSLNGLLKISPANLTSFTLPFSISIGKFEGRKETTCYLKDPNSGLFVFVLEGAK